MITPNWTWQQPGWPHFTWNDAALAHLLRDCQHVQGQLLDVAGATTHEMQAEYALDTLLSNIITTSAIEGERLNEGSVRSSLARRLSFAETPARRATARVEGLVELMLDATRNVEAPFDMARLLRWHCWLFAANDDLLPHRIRIGALRGNKPMQIVSGRIDRPKVHFEAPPREGLEDLLEDFLSWFKATRNDSGFDPLLRAGIAHLWFVTLHPFDDGNGRLTRALTDLALAQTQPQAIHFHAMSASIWANQAGYYRILESSQKHGLDITSWLQWFLSTLHDSLVRAVHSIDRILVKEYFWQIHNTKSLSADQIKVLNRLLDGGDRGFEQGINARQYQAVAKVSKATAIGHIADLVEKGCLRCLPGGIRNIRYKINTPPMGIPPASFTRSTQDPSA